MPDNALSRAGVSPDSASTRPIDRSRWIANEFIERAASRTSCPVTQQTLALLPVVSLTTGSGGGYATRPGGLARGRPRPRGGLLCAAPGCRADRPVRPAWSVVLLP